MTHSTFLPSSPCPITNRELQARKEKQTFCKPPPASKTLTLLPPMLDTVSFPPRVSSRSDTLFCYPGQGGGPRNRRRARERTGTGAILNQSIQAAFGQLMCLLSQPLARANPVAKHYPFIHLWNLSSAALIWPCPPLLAEFTHFSCLLFHHLSPM